jgi:putative mRNA 3-end processing factor
VLGSAQAVIAWNGMTIAVSGDYKRRRDPTCPPFEPVACDVFVSEATFGLPVFIHPPDGEEIAKLLQSGCCARLAMTRLYICMVPWPG